MHLQDVGSPQLYAFKKTPFRKYNVYNDVLSDAIARRSCLLTST